MVSITEPGDFLAFTLQTDQNLAEAKKRPGNIAGLFET
jgi:hypothetical protein